MFIIALGLFKIPLFDIAEYADVISSGITSDTPNAIDSTALILVVKPNNLGKLSGSGWGLGYLGGLVSLIIMLLLFVEQENGLILLGNNPIFGLDS